MFDDSHLKSHIGHPWLYSPHLPRTLCFDDSQHLKSPHTGHPGCTGPISCRKRRPYSQHRRRLQANGPTMVQLPILGETRVLAICGRGDPTFAIHRTAPAGVAAKLSGLTVFLDTALHSSLTKVHRPNFWQEGVADGDQSSVQAVTRTTAIMCALASGRVCPNRKAIGSPRRVSTH